MNKISVQRQTDLRSTIIPNIFFDRYMPQANGEFLKVYLYLFRQSQDSLADISLSSIADTFNMTESDVKRALRYWEKENLLTIEYLTCGDIGIIHLNDFESKSNPVTLVVPNKTDKSAGYNKPSYSMQQIQSFTDDYDGNQLFFVIQQYLGKPLSQTDINTIVFFHEQLGLSVDLIEYLFEYCVSNNHRSMHYIEKVAISWANQKIDTIQKAKDNRTYYNKTYYTVLKAFGINNRQPIESEIASIKKWQEEYCFSLPMILEACNRTMQATHSPSFEYTDSILKNWRAKNVKNMEDVLELDKLRTKKKTTHAKSTNNKFHNFTQRSYDYDDLEKKLAEKLQTRVPKGS